VKKWALLSVFDKRGIVELGTALQAAGLGILSTGGTAKTLSEAGLEVTKVEDYTGFPEMMDGRVKTLHPRIHGGLLGLRDDANHVAKMVEHKIDAIDVVVVNLYPFQETIARPGVTFEQAVEMIDIGGPSMLRAAAKNHRFVTTLVSPDDYGWVVAALTSAAGITETQRLELALKVFAVTAHYDAAIAAYLADATHKQAMESAAQKSTTDESSESIWPPFYTVSFRAKQALRYGENPHQSAHFYAEDNASDATIAGAIQLQGKELSYNNIQDADAALQLLRSFDDMQTPAVVAIKHMNPCGVGIGADIEEAYDRAYKADAVSIFGGIVAFNRSVTGALAERLTGLFLEIVMAPSFSEEAKEIFQKRKNVRLLEVNLDKPLWAAHDRIFRRVSGGLLVQDVNRSIQTSWQVVTKRQPSAEECTALAFAWRVVKHVKSNAIVIANDFMTLGIGAGQMNRVGAAKIAIEQAAAKAYGSALASDAFLPMRDTVDAAAAAGVKTIIQPGGSIRDAESIEAADEHDIAMVFTGQRHFMH